MLDLHTIESPLVIVSARGRHGGWPTLLQRLPRLPAVYAWFRRISIQEDLAPDEFAREVESLVTAATAPLHSASIGPFHAVDLHQRATLRDTRRAYLQAVARDPSRRHYLAAALRRATPLQAPLYVGKAQDLRQRIEQHLDPMSELASRLREGASIHLMECELVYTLIEGARDDDKFLRFVEELITYICRPGFVIRPG